MRPSVLLAVAALAALAACDRQPLSPADLLTPSSAAHARSSASTFVINVTNDTTAQNETPIAVNPRNPLNFVVGGNDWNYNDGCAVNASLDGGKSWTPTLPNGFVPGITKYTNDPAVPGTGAYDFGRDPAVGFGPN